MNGKNIDKMPGVSDLWHVFIKNKLKWTYKNVGMPCVLL